MKITPVVVKQFKEFLKRNVKPDADLEVIGINLQDDSTVKQFLKEFCLDLTYNECKRKVMELYPQLFKYSPAEYHEEALRQMNYYLGTPYVSEAFKKIYQKYEPMFKDYSILEKWDETELSLIYDVLTARYNCVDFDIRTLGDLGYLSVKTQNLGRQPVDKALYQLFYLGYLIDDERPTYITKLRELGVMGYLTNYYLICIVEYGKAEGDDTGTIITSSKDPFIIVNMARKRATIIY